jgi:hypothetical protein
MSNKTSDKNVANDSVIAHKFAVMQQQINEKDKRIQELEEELENNIPKQVVIDKIKEYDKKMEEDAGHPNWVVTDRIVMNVLQELLETK